MLSIFLLDNYSWVTVLHASSKIGSSVYDLWTGPSGTSKWKGDLKRTDKKFNSHYKSPIVEQWNTLKIKQVNVKAEH